MKTDPAQPELVALFTDFGGDGLYVGQMKAVLARLAPRVPVVDLMSNAPVFNPRASAYLLAALAGSMPAGTLFLGVVDPGVGSDRGALAVRAGSRWFVGPDNGLFSRAWRDAEAVEIRSIEWRPPGCSDSFHGRDLFAPVAGQLCRGERPAGRPLEPGDLVGADWPDQLEEVIYVDHFGNLVTGIRAGSLDLASQLLVGGERVAYARTFSSVPGGAPFWYRNSIGLVEIAANRGRACELLGVAEGEPVAPCPSP